MPSKLMNPRNFSTVVSQGFGLILLLELLQIFNRLTSFHTSCTKFHTPLSILLQIFATLEVSVACHRCLSYLCEAQINCSDSKLEEHSPASMLLNIKYFRGDQKARMLHVHAPSWSSCLPKLYILCSTHQLQRGLEHLMIQISPVIRSAQKNRNTPKGRRTGSSKLNF